MALKNILIIVFVVILVMAAVKVFNLQLPPVYQPVQTSELQSDVATPVVGENASNETVSNTSADDLTPVPLRYALDQNNNSVSLVDYVEPFCGDGVCNVDEVCSTCQDCACSSSQRCTSEGLCVANESCGDSVCTNSERVSRSCCADCGCGANLLCNKNIQACLPLAQLTPVKLNQSVQAALQLPGYGNYTYAGAYDDYYNDKVVKTIVLRCPGNPQFHCEAYIYVDSNGNIVGTEHTV